MKKPSPTSKGGASAGKVSTYAKSAQNSGFSFISSPNQTTTSCLATPNPFWGDNPWDISAQIMGPQPAEPKPKPTKPCDVKTLKLDIVAAQKTHSVSLSSQRRREAVASNVPGSYRYKLQHKDLVVEIIAPVKETTTTYARNKPSVTKASKDHDPVKVTATATPASSCGQTHPGLSASGGDVNESSERKPIKFDVFSPAPSTVRSSSWGRLWPFGDNKSEEIAVKADSCGFVPGGKPTKDLSVLLVALPDEIWKITLGLGTYMSGSASRERKANTGAGGKSTGMVVAYERQRGSTSSSDRATYVAGSKFSDEFTNSTTSGVLLRRTDTNETEMRDGWATSGTKKSKKLRKIKIEHTVGGQTSEADVSKIANGIIDALDTIEDLSKIFDGIPKVGWSISTSFKFLTGSATLEWGHRWPRSFAENNRVYYAERFITLGGTVELASGSVEVFFGVEIDPWWAPVYFVAKLYLEVSASVSISPSGTVTVTNWKDRDLDLNPMDLDAKAEVKLDLGATAGGRAAGYELRATLKLEGDLTAEIDGKISRKGPDAKVTIKTDGAHIKGEVLVVGRRRKTYDFEPIEVIKPRDFIKDKVIF